MHVQAVLGPIAPEALGQTLMHEHLLITNPSFVEPTEPGARALAYAPVALENLGWVRQHWTSNRDNLVLDDESLARRELARFAAAGGGAIVDATVDGIGRDPLALRRISSATGVAIVMGTGAYVSRTHPDAMARLDVDGVAEIIVSECRDGVRETGIRPGLIGEIGCSWPIAERERTVLAGAARAQAATGLPLMVHPGRNRAAPFEIVDWLARCGADLARVIVAHLDRTITDLPGLVELAAAGVWLEFDCFGLETSYYPFDPALTTLSDAQRLALVRGLADRGLLGRVLVSQDICTKHRLAAYGGHGYDHLLVNVKPWMLQRGFSEDEVRTLLVDNPAEVLTIRAA